MMLQDNKNTQAIQCLRAKPQDIAGSIVEPFLELRPEMTKKFFSMFKEYITEKYTYEDYMFNKIKENIKADNIDAIVLKFIGEREPHEWVDKHEKKSEERQEEFFRKMDHLQKLEQQLGDKNPKDVPEWRKEVATIVEDFQSNHYFTWDSGTATIVKDLFLQKSIKIQEIAMRLQHVVKELQKRLDLQNKYEKGIEHINPEVLEDKISIAKQIIRNKSEELKSAPEPNPAKELAEKLMKIEALSKIRGKNELSEDDISEVYSDEDNDDRSLQDMELPSNI
jgi:hypothetical protein